MRWSKKLIDFWIEFYYTLKSHETKFWQEMDNYSGEAARHGKGGRFRAPFIPTADKNIEFDLAITKLGVLGEQVFRLCFLDGYTLDEAIKRINGFRVKQIIECRRTVKREFVNYLLGAG